jgi:hypothetical protein
VREDLCAVLRDLVEEWTSFGLYLSEVGWFLFGQFEDLGEWGEALLERLVSRGGS